MNINRQNYMRFMGKTTFKLGGRTMEHLDCYGLVMALYAMEGIELPEVKTPDTNIGINIIMDQKIDRHWAACEDEPGALVHVQVPKVFSHVGMSLGSGQFVHIWPGSNSVEVQSTLEWEHRIKGFYRFVGRI